MRSLLLLILSLMTGGVVSSEVEVCKDGWVEFTCTYPKSRKQCGVVLPNKKIIHSAQEDDIQNQDFGVYKYKCQCDQYEQEVEIGEYHCQRPFIQTAYRSAKTTITCDYPKDKSSVKIFCKDNGVICEDILSTNSSQRSNGTFTLIETKRGFNISISDVSSSHAGVYWCGVKSQRYRAALRKIQLRVEDITELKESPMIGQTFTYWCEYPNSAPINKFICKGEDPSMCERLANTGQHNTGRFSMKQNIRRTNSTITVREVTADDAGTYWCGAESTDRTRSNPFFHRLVMIVVSSPTLTPSVTSPTSHHPVATSTASSTQSTAVTAGQTSVLAPVGLSLNVLWLLLMLIITYSVYKEFASRKNKNTTRRGA